MTNRQFTTQLSAVTLVTAIGLFILLGLPKFVTYQTLGWTALAGFTLLSLVMYFVGYRTANSDDKNAFTSAALGFTMGKMLLTVTLIFVYMKVAEPMDKLFVIPVLGVYVVFTIFETYFMMKLGRMGV